MSALQNAYSSPMAGSPTLTFSPSIGTDPSTSWVFNVPFGNEPSYATSLDKASLSFDFYGRPFQLTGLLAPPVDDPPAACWTNTTINGVLQDYPYGYNYVLPTDNYHVEVEFFCPEERQEAWFHLVEFVPRYPACMSPLAYYLPDEDLKKIGEWSEETVTIPMWGSSSPDFTQYTSHTFGSTLEYSFKGTESQIFGEVVPDGSAYIITLDGIPSPVYISKNVVVPADFAAGAVLWYAQYLDANKTHTVTLTNLGSHLVVQAIQYTSLTTMNPCE